MRTTPKILLATGICLALAACGDSNDASTEAMPDTVEMPAEEALVSVEQEPVDDRQVAGPPAATPAPPDPVTTEEAADAAVDVAAEAEAALQAAEAAELEGE